MESRGLRAQGLVTKAQLRADGVSEGGLLRAVACKDVLRVQPAVYALEPLPVRPRFLVTDTGVAAAYVAHVRAVLLSLGATATARGRTAAALLGWAMLVEPTRTLDVAVPHGRSSVRLPLAQAEQRRRLARISQAVLPGTDPIWVTSALQTAVDCALRLPLLEAVVLCDSGLRNAALDRDDLEVLVGRLPGVRDARRLRRVVELADGRSGSVLESVQRVQLVLGGIDGFDLQIVVRDDPTLRVDFCFRAAGLVVEVDGARWHQDPARDQARDNALAALGWRVLRFTWAQVVHESEQVLARVREALAAGGPSFHLLGGVEAAAA